MLLDRVRRRDKCFSWNALWCEDKDVAPVPEYSGTWGMGTLSKLVWEQDGLSKAPTRQ